MPPFLDLLLGQSQERGQLSALCEHDGCSLHIPAGDFLPLELVACLEGVLSRVLDVLVESDNLVL
jgi:hypothetical protein